MNFPRYTKNIHLPRVRWSDGSRLGCWQSRPRVLRRWRPQVLKWGTQRTRSTRRCSSRGARIGTVDTATWRSGASSGAMDAARVSRASPCLFPRWRRPTNAGRRKLLAGHQTPTHLHPTATSSQGGRRDNGEFSLLVIWFVWLCAIVALARVLY
jgi:hypothetical protein